MITIPLEGTGRIVLDAATREDKLRLRRWLRRSRQLHALPACLDRLLDDLDELDREAA